MQLLIKGSNSSHKTKNMTPKEKSKELIGLFIKPIDDLHKYPMCIETAKQCALISANESYDALYNYLKDTDELQNADREFAYWEQVKKEIINYGKF
jgi:hypothetical protein